MRENMGDNLSERKKKENVRGNKRENLREQKTGLVAGMLPGAHCVFSTRLLFRAYHGIAPLSVQFLNTVLHHLY